MTRQLVRYAAIGLVAFAAVVEVGCQSARETAEPSPSAGGEAVTPERLEIVYFLGAAAFRAKIGLDKPQTDRTIVQEEDLILDGDDVL